MKDILATYTLKELKQEVKKANDKLNIIKRYSTLNKPQLINLMIEHKDKFKHLKQKEKKIIKKEPKKIIKKEPKKETKKIIKEEPKKETEEEKILKLINNQTNSIKLLSDKILTPKQIKNKGMNQKEGMKYLEGLSTEFNNLNKERLEINKFLAGKNKSDFPIITKQINILENKLKNFKTRLLKNRRDLKNDYNHLFSTKEEKQKQFEIKNSKLPNVKITTYEPELQGLQKHVKEYLENEGHSINFHKIN